MKKILLSAALLSLLISCNTTPQGQAEKLVKNYLDKTMNDPSSYESISFTPLDSTFTEYAKSVEAAKIQAEISKLQWQSDSLKYADKPAEALIKIREAIALDSIYNLNKDNYKGEFNGWVTIHNYRGNNAMGGKVKAKTAFFLNPDLTIVNEALSLN